MRDASQILDAARRCFTRNGFQATSMQDIFTASGLSAGAVYSHFTGKDEIVTAIADEVIDTITASFDGAIADSKAHGLEDILEKFFTALQQPTSPPSRSPCGPKRSATPHCAGG